VQTSPWIRVLRTLPIPLAAGLLWSCSNDGGTSPEDPPGPTTLTIALGVDTAIPSARVPLSGVPEALDLGDVHARVSDPTTGETWTTAVGRDDDGTPFLVAPLRAADPVGGGDVEVSLVGETVTSNPVPLHVDELPEATASTVDLVEHLQELCTTWLTQHGTTREELRSMDPATMPVRLIPLFVTQELLDGPDNPSSLRAMVDGPVPLFENEVIDLDVLDRLLSTVDSDAFFDPEITSVDSATTAQDGRGRPYDDAAAPGADAGDAAPGGARGARSAGCIEGGDYGIDTATELDRAMWASRFAQARLGGASGRYLNDLGRFVGVLGQIPQLKKLASVVGGALYVYKALNEASSGVLPSSFDYGATDFDIEDQDEFYEDDEGGNWANFHVTAVSQGWKMDQFILEAIAQVAGFEDLGGLGTLTDGLSEVAAQLTEFAINKTIGNLIGAVAGGSDFVEICPGRWPGIDVSELPWSEAEVAFGTSVELIDRTFFETREPGVSQLKLETVEGFFGDAEPPSKTKPVEVLLIDVEVTPDVAYLDPGQEADFSATVTNARDDRVRWILPDGLTEISQSDFGRTIRVKAPSEPWSPPLTLTARSLAETGSREGMVDADPRDGGAVVASGSRAIIVTPQAPCVASGDTLRFTATVFGLDEYEIEWSIASGWGSIDQTGLYRAPEIGTTDDVIVAQVVGEDDLQDHANVRTGACFCSFQLNVAGDAVISIGGYDIAYQVVDFGEEFGSIQWYIQFPRDPDGVPFKGGFSASVLGDEANPIPQPGDTGNFAANAVYVSPAGDSWAGNQKEEDARVTLHIDEYTPTFMEGTISGTLVQRRDPKDPDRVTSSVFVSMPFRAGLFDGSWPCTE